MEENEIRLTVLESALLFLLWEDLGENASTPGMPDWSRLEKRYGREGPAFSQIFQNLWVKGILERTPVKRAKKNTHFGYYKKAVRQVYVQNWGVVTLGGQIPAALKEDHEDALYGIRKRIRYG